MDIYDNITDTEEIASRIENCRCSGGQVLDLSALDMKELPAEAESFENLGELNISYNKLKSLPDCIGKLRSLKKLYIRGNSIDTLPEWLGDFAHLEELDISDNELRIVPEFIGKLKNLHTINLGYSNEGDYQSIYGKLILFRRGDELEFDLE
jgi:Leucine-rich repeat (LRR) protein